MIYFLRHAQGEHNAAELKYGKKAWDAKYSKILKYLDAPLTALGKANSKLVQAHMDSKEQFPLDLVVVSPLQCAIRTALIVFNSTNSSRPTIAVETCRETLCVHTYYERHNVSYLSTTFPSVNFTSIAAGPDPLWTSTNRET